MTSLYMWKKIIKKIRAKIDLLEALINYLKLLEIIWITLDVTFSHNVFKHILITCNRFLFLQKNKYFFFTIFIDEYLILGKDKRIEDKIIKDIRNIFSLKKEISSSVIKDVRNPFGLKKVKMATQLKI